MKIWQQERGLLRAFASLRHRNYRLYWFGQLISLIGTGMQTTGQAWLVLELTHSGLQLGLVGALQYLPVLLFTIFGGVFADRWSKRRILLVTQSIFMIQALLLWILAATGDVQLWQIYVLAMLLGLTSCLDQPARSAFIVEMVGREDLANAVALNSTLLSLTRIVGPGFAGIIIAASGVTQLFLLNALSFLAMIVALAMIDTRSLFAQGFRTGSKSEPGGEGKPQNTWQSLREGVDYVMKAPPVVLLILVIGLVLLFGANYNVVLPLIATDVLHVGARGFGFLSASMSIGSLVAALWLAWSNARPTIRRVLLGTLIFGVLETGFALSRVYLLSLALIASVGAMETIFGALTITAIQIVVPDHLRGRVISVYILFFTGSIPFGSLLAGWLSSLYGVSVGLIICMMLSLLTTAVGWIWRKPAEQHYTESARM